MHQQEISVFHFSKKNGVKSVIVAGVKVVICFETVCQGMRIKTGIIFIYT